ncbi:hypothetical protein C1O63_0508 [Dehalococcoides mccartyi]|uniref:hypothetical protein n=1 Tax=Dehalococcoides mccartyi TaxID=61435 RepID=UPI0002B768AF|nr:hypothetical protein [Dehalococcoides mccartyi]AGG07359.1 hypothetical protein btf_250 [Dehalococcoides mccartyi BTF08]AQW61812.1 hypothetical protein B1779_00535 [Dehalococcoides mccartyi]POZ59430.1 hypothetical protein C1O63_0508 [Dehalococcoides mccartyi]
MNNWFAPLQWLVFLALWRMSYETANVNKPANSEKSFLIEKTSPLEAGNPREKEWTEKAINKYADAQEKKWQHWNEAMFERSD